MLTTEMQKKKTKTEKKTERKKSSMMVSVVHKQRLEWRFIKNRKGFDIYIKKDLMRKGKQQVMMRRPVFWCRELMHEDPRTWRWGRNKNRLTGNNGPLGIKGHCAEYYEMLFFGKKMHFFRRTTITWAVHPGSSVKLSVMVTMGLACSRES